MSYEVKVVRDVRIPTKDPAVTLSGDLFIATTADAIPALVTALPYRNDAGSGIESDATLRWLASQGYGCLLVDFRGTGSSDGEQRPPFDPGEADDSLASIEWVARQPWCSGYVGMWGISYGAIMTMRAAARQPEHLRAILPIEGVLDPERDFIHPAGNRGCAGSLGLWGTETLLNQLMPPLQDYGADEQQRRWLHRCRAVEPWFLDLVRHGPGHPVWRSRAIDASKIIVPSFLVAGWRDLFCNATLHAYESILAPKKLLAGPWMHTFPDTSPFEAIEFRSLVIRWWDHWLKGIDTGIMQEPPVTVFVQGARPEWRNLPAWPPRGTARAFATKRDLTLRPTVGDGSIMEKPSSAIGAWKTDATVGALSGLWGFATSGFGLPVDQHDDDARSLAATSTVIDADMIVVDRPVVRVKWAGQCSPNRLVARLTSVDEQGVSTLVSIGLLSAPQPGALHEIVLNPTCYRVKRGSRLRISLGNADFPRLWPADVSAAKSPEIAGIELAIRELLEDEGVIVKFSAPDYLDSTQGPLAMHLQPIWKITRDPVVDGIKVVVGQKLLSFTPNREHLLELNTQVTAMVIRDEPYRAAANCTSAATIRMKSGETIVVRVRTRLDRTTAHASADIAIDGCPVSVWEWTV